MDKEIKAKKERCKPKEHLFTKTVGEPIKMQRAFEKKIDILIRAKCGRCGLIKTIQVK